MKNFSFLKRLIAFSAAIALTITSVSTQAPVIAKEADNVEEVNELSEVKETLDSLEDLDDYRITLSQENVSVSSAASASAITIDWNGELDDITEVSHYTFQYKKKGDKDYKGIIIGVDESRAAIKDLNQFDAYIFRVITHLKDGKDTSSVIDDFDTVTVTAPPYPVENLRVTDRYNTEIDLKWAANPATNVAISYNIYQSSDNKTYTFLASTTDTNYDVTGLAKNTGYYFQVKPQASVPDYNNEISIVEGSGNTIQTSTTNAANLDNILNLKVTKEKVNAIVLDWSPVKNASRYRVYRKAPGETAFKVLSKERKSTYTDSAVESGVMYEYKIVALSDDTGSESAESTIVGVAKPKVPKKITYALTSSRVAISWEGRGKCTGYLIYKYNSTTGKYDYYANTTEQSFADTKVVSATAYRYYIKAYTLDANHASAESDIIKISTLPDAPVITAKAGTTKVRIKWKKIARCTGYKVYMKNAAGTYDLKETIKGRTIVKTTINDIPSGYNTSFMVTAYKTAFEMDFPSFWSNEANVTTLGTFTTNTDAYLYKTKKKVMASAAWKSVKDYAKYNKSMIIPGLKSTDCNGFQSTNMCPQGFTIAKNFALISAYDRDKEENSVLYVLNKKNKTLRKVLCLPNAAHVGGVCFDGTYIWVTSADNSIACFSFKKLKEALASESASVDITFDYECKTETKASFITYRNDMLWVGTYDEKANGTLNAYYISLDSEDGLVLTKAYNMTLPSAVQGIVFNKKYLLVSRAYSTTHEIDIYKPKKSGKQKMTLGNIQKKITTPYLNEDMEIDGNFLYVNFESAVSPAAPNKIDRVLALSLKKVVKGLK